jgi:hypothetical protein
METLAFQLLVTMQSKNTGVVSISMEILWLPSNDSLRSNMSHCSSLRLFVPNGLTEYNNLFSWHVSGPVFAVVVLQLLPLFNLGGGWSPAVPAAPSLRPFVPSGSLMRCGCFHVPINFYSFFLILEGPMLQCFRSLHCQQILLTLGRWPNLPKCVLINFSYCDK